MICSEKTVPNCTEDAWSIDHQATLHSDKDIDYYELRVLDARTPIIVQAYGGSSERTLSIAYRCPDGLDGMDECSGDTDSIQGLKFCTVDGDNIGIERRCDSGAGTANGTVLVAVQAKEFRTDCDAYGLHVFATYQIGLPDD